MPYFYQVYGWRSHAKRDRNIPPSVDTVARQIWAELQKNEQRPEEERLEVYLGLTHCGATYLLLSAEDLDRVKYESGNKMRPTSSLRDMFVGTPVEARRFALVSPITFPSFDALKAKIKSYEHKKAKKDADNSSANKKYTLTVSRSDVWTDLGLERLFFESQRVFYRICTGQVAPSNYGVTRVPWFNDIRAFSFAFTLWRSDTRSKEDRLRDPKVLDVGYAEYFLPGGSSGLTVLENHHYPVKENSMIRNPNRVEFFYGATEEQSGAELASKLQELFKPNYNSPILLFVKDAEWTLATLRFLGVDTSTWSTAFEPLLGRVPLRDPHGRSKPEEDDRSIKREVDQRRYQRDPRVKSDRSRSPSRRDGSSQWKRPASPEPLRSPHPVYVVDIFNMFSAMSDMPVRMETETINSIAEKLRVKNDAKLDGSAPTMDKGAWCAGNDARLLGYIWSAMASGNAIDEQKGEMEARRRTSSDRNDDLQPPPRAPAPAPASDNWDDEADPNDITPAPGASAPPKRDDPYAAYEDSDYDDWD